MCKIALLLLSIAAVSCQNAGNTSINAVTTVKQLDYISEVCADGSDKVQRKSGRIQVSGKAKDSPITTKLSMFCLKERAGCGWRNPKGLGSQLQASSETRLAEYGEFPWIVAVFKVMPSEKNSSTPNLYVGGGSLITPSVVLTCAHNKAADIAWRVRAGDWDMQTTKELYPHQERDVKRVDIHKDFNDGNLFYDIAVLILEKPMDLAPNVGIACLPAAGERVDAGTRCFATGWGVDTFGTSGAISNNRGTLKKVEVPVVDRNTCKDELRKTRLKSLFELHSSFMCAGGEDGEDTCTGDGGSPLVCPAQYELDRYVQYGIVSWGIGCGNGTPSVYVDVGKMRDWIDDKVAGIGENPSLYTLV